MFGAFIYNAKANLIFVRLDEFGVVGLVEDGTELESMACFAGLSNQRDLSPEEGHTCFVVPWTSSHSTTTSIHVAGLRPVLSGGFISCKRILQGFVWLWSNAECHAILILNGTQGVT